MLKSERGKFDVDGCPIGTSQGPRPVPFARAAADRFASDSGSKVGSIRQANQGVFSILSADQGSDTSEDGGAGGEIFSADTSLMKTVRVVTTVQYYLDK